MLPVKKRGIQHLPDMEEVLAVTCMIVIEVLTIEKEEGVALEEDTEEALAVVVGTMLEEVAEMTDEMAPAVLTEAIIAKIGNQEIEAIIG